MNVPSSLSPPRPFPPATTRLSRASRLSRAGYFNGTDDIMSPSKYTDHVKDADLISSYHNEEEEPQKYDTQLQHFPVLPPTTTPTPGSPRAQPRKKSKKSNPGSPRKPSPFQFGPNGTISTAGIGVGSSTRKKTPPNNNNPDTTERCCKCAPTSSMSCEQSVCACWKAALRCTAHCCNYDNACSNRSDESIPLPLPGSVPDFFKNNTATTPTTPTTLVIVDDSISNVDDSPPTLGTVSYTHLTLPTSARV